MSASKEYFQRLDILRFLAFFVVFINHIAYFLVYPSSIREMGTAAFTYLQIGDLGVAFFFVLSGFLITYLLEKERLNYGKISLKNFYMRRVLRIWPLYFFAIGLILLISYLFQGFDLYKLFINPKEFFYHFFFIGNFFRALEGTSNEMLAILWSIAVEEQFYLVWPIVFIFFRKHIQYILGIGIIISMFYRYKYANNFEMREFYTLCVMIYLLVGSFVGIYANKLKTLIENKAGLVSSASFVCVFLLLSIRGVYTYSYPPLFIAIDGLIFAICFALIIISAAFGKQPTEIKKLWQMAGKKLGVISYGLYVYHMIVLTLVIQIVRSLGINLSTLNILSFFVLAFTVFSLTVFFSFISYNYIELPFLKLKNKFNKIS
jgi:peptidoglycan/LPS O-acetylase OafA/YrhL